jgi:hypothetical protein
VLEQYANDTIEADHGRLEARLRPMRALKRSARCESSFAYDVITVEVDPSTATVVMAERYSAADLYAEFRATWELKYRHINASFAA